MFARQNRGFGALLFILAATATGCSETAGSGVRATESRSIGAFEQIDASGVDVRVVVDPGAATDKLEVVGDDNLVPLVRTRVDGSRLVVDVTDYDIDPSAGLVVILRTARLTRIHADRSARVDVRLTATGTLLVDAESSASVTAHGKVDRLEAELTGSASLLAQDLVARDVKLEATGSATAHVCVTGTLDADLSGGSRASYSCDPVNVERDVAGGAHLDAR
jgi:hypothetical protein